MIYLYIIACAALAVSAMKNMTKTKKSLKVAWSMFLKMLPLLLFMLSLVSIVLFFLPDHIIAQYLGVSNKGLGMLLAAVFGSVSLLPGFITFPLSGLLLDQGVSYMVLATFTTTLMMVGVVTFPLEKEVLGMRLAILRNLAGLLIAIVVSLVIGLAYGELI